jgi:predicted protein tyrosine phosphatase
MPSLITRVPRIHVCGVPELDASLKRRFSHIVSIWDPEWIERGGVEDELRRRIFEKTRLHVAYFHDVSTEETGRIAPVEDDLRRILAFTRELEADSEILVHCWAGISRSTAVAYAILCQATGPERERECIEAVIAARPQAFPNSLIVELCDKILERGGSMRRVCDEMLSEIFSGLGRRSN